MIAHDILHFVDLDSASANGTSSFALGLRQVPNRGFGGVKCIPPQVDGREMVRRDIKGKGGLEGAGGDEGDVEAEGVECGRGNSECRRG